ITDDGFMISYTDEVSTETFELTYDEVNQTIALNHIEFLYFLDGDLIYPDYYYLTEDSDLRSYQFSDPVSFDLESYHLSPITYQNEYYLPLSLANLFFSGFDTNLYFNGVSLYATDSAIDPVDFPIRYTSQDMPLDLQMHVIDYLAFYFDYFYGLNFDQEPYYYKDLLFPLKENLEGDNLSFYTLIDFLIKDFDDMHMGLAFEGYYGDVYEFNDDAYIYQGRTKKNMDDEEVYQDYCENTHSQKLNTEISLLVVNTFDTYTAEIFAYEKDMLVNDDTTDVIIDFTCNAGGFMYAMMDMLPYVMNNPLQITFKHHTLGAMHQYYFTSGINKLSANLYIKTSSLTYSAANIFTLYAKAYGDAIVIGEQSSGGSSHVDTVFAPAGMLIQVPFAFHLTTHLGENFEYGVPVDHIFTSQDLVDLIDLIEEIT
ncbi:MAG: S41 family peptidase, partial [Acholeplasmataceae bacterium]